jgi:hypothetical protein
MMIVKKMDAFSLAKIYGVMGVIFGVIAGVLVGIISSIMGALSSSVEGMGERAGLLNLGWIALIILPIAYGTFFFLAGLISAGIYNIIAKMIGGMKIELESEEGSSVQQSAPKNKM